MIACDRHILTASALAVGGGILPGPALLLRLDLALRRP
jgi:hypothetical protein